MAEKQEEEETKTTKEKEVQCAKWCENALVFTDVIFRDAAVCKAADEFVTITGRDPIPLSAMGTLLQRTACCVLSNVRNTTNPAVMREYDQLLTSLYHAWCHIQTAMRITRM